MYEMGKAHLLRNLIRCVSELPAIDEIKYSGSDFPFFRWSSSVSRLIFQDNGDVPVIEPQGRADLNSLIYMLEQLLIAEQNINILFLSDGNFSSSSITDFRKRLEPESGLIIRTIAVGPDADTLKLEKLVFYNRKLTPFYNRKLTHLIKNNYPFCLSFCPSSTL